MSLRRALLTLGLSSLAFACKSAPSTTSDASTGTIANDGNDATAIGASPSAAASVALMGTASAASDASAVSDAETRAAKDLIQAWSRALDLHDLAALAPMYAPRVMFYGRDVPRAVVLAAKTRALGPGSTFHQSITSDIMVVRADDGTMRASFTKRSGAGSPPRVTDVAARVGMVRGDGGALAIVEETDVPSQGRATEMNRAGCHLAAAAAVHDLPAVKKLLADTQHEIDAHYKDRHLGGWGPIDEADGFSAALGVDQPERFENMVLYGVHAGKLTVTVMGEDVEISKDRQEAVAKACQ